MIGSGTRTCPVCGRVQPLTVDFCDCGAYLAWSDVPAQEAPTTADPAPEPAPAAPKVLLFVTAGATVFQEGQDLSVPVAPGSAIDMVATIRNLSRVVDTYTLTVEGVPASWVELPAARVNLMPVGAVGDYEGKLPLRIRVPLSSEALAGEREIDFVLRSGARDEEVARVPGALTIAPFFALVFAARPAVVTGRRGATVRAELRNSGNAPIVPRVVASDADAACTFKVPERMLAIAPAATIDVPIRVRARGRLYGRPVDRALTVGATASGLPDPAPKQTVVFRQRALIPWWVPIIALALLGLALAAYAVLSAHRKVTVPALRGASSAFVAQRTLQARGFTAPPIVKSRVVAGKKSGTVLDQAPQAGEKVSPATVVTIRVAVPPATTIIPDLRGREAKFADGILTHTHLALGTVVPSKDGSRLIVGQSPLPGNVRPRGTAVNIVVEGKGPVAVPKVTCVTVAVAEQRLAKAGLKALNLADFTDTTTIVTGQVPAAKQKRPPLTAVQLMFDDAAAKKCKSSKSGKGGSPNAGASSVTGSSGADPTATTAAAAPSVAGLGYDDGVVVRMARSSRAAVPGRQAAWSPGGSLRAVVAGGQVVVSGPGLATPVRIAAADGPASAPAFAPVAPRPLVAFVAGGDGVCLARLAGAEPDCLDLPGMAPRAVAFGADGTTLLVVAAPAGDLAHPGVLTLTTSRPGSPHLADYRGGTELVRPMVGGVQGSIFALAPRPGSEVVAIATDLGRRGRLGAVGVVLVDARRLGTLTGARWTGRRGCQVAFDRTGDRLAIAGGGAAVTSCPARPAPGPVVVVAADGGGATAAVTPSGASPAWEAQP
ncbi:hypothetical protein DSM104299_02211 [Baekduia alba]|uniref:PASTA domain-containing protein n=1 Tax=Baekduia alba TaxID=2997333 RepID=UPI002341FF5D|nr:PASTA domain-containing protein [Baekduia alba]WCB93498.1 hypothetical protein DSM104299_02211 [Baekduia alba]